MTLFPHGDLSHTQPPLFRDAQEIHEGLRLSMSIIVEERLMLGMANVPLLIGAPQGFSSKHRKQPWLFITTSVITAQHVESLSCHPLPLNLTNQPVDPTQIRHIVNARQVIPATP